MMAYYFYYETPKPIKNLAKLQFPRADNGLALRTKKAEPALYALQFAILAAT